MMIEFNIHKKELSENGFTVINNVFSKEEIAAIISIIEKADSTKSTFRKTADLFAIRQFLKEVPETLPYIFNYSLRSIINQIFGKGYFVVKSIYFDKPPHSNWFVAYHQDLTVSVDKKVDIADFGPWTVKQNQYAVQPSLTILEANFTIRIHLDYTDENNGALKVLPGSHRKGIYRTETIDWQKETELSCNVAEGGIMLMKPLLLHASGRSTNNNKRRVIHVEFSNQSLPEPLHWSEKLCFGE